MKISFVIEIEHPIFGDNCQVFIEYDCTYVPANYEGHYLESSAYYEFESIKVIEINEKKYSKNILESMSTFLVNNYVEKMGDIYEKELYRLEAPVIWGSPALA